MCDSRRLKINVGNGEMLVAKKDKRGSCEKVKVTAEEMQEVENFKYL